MAWLEQGQAGQGLVLGLLVLLGAPIASMFSGDHRLHLTLDASL